MLGGIALCCLIGPAATAVDCHRGSRLKEKSQGCGVEHLKNKEVCIVGNFIGSSVVLTGMPSPPRSRKCSYHVSRLMSLELTLKCFTCQ